jgi:RNA polymerase sigma-70 factor (ECF subfamily)
VEQPKQAQAARREAFESLAMPHAVRLRASARRWFRHEATADDAVQETFLRAYRTFDAFEPGTNARAWLFTILYSVCANEHARARGHAATSLEDVTEELLYRSEQFAPRAALPEPTGTEVERALGALPEPFKSALTFVDVEELSYEEAASALGCPVGTLRSRLSRGRKALAEKLAHLAPRTRTAS